MIEVFPSCSIAEYLTSIEMIGDVCVGDEPNVYLSLLSCCRDYLGKLVRVAAFFPSNVASVAPNAAETIWPGLV